MDASTKHHGFLIALLLGATALLSTAGLFSGYQAKEHAGPLRHGGRLAAWSGGGAHGSLPARRASPVRHVVVIYLENHSFDNVLGFWCDDHPRRCPQGGMPASVTLSDGTVVAPSIDPDTVPFVLHNVPSQEAAINGGKMDGWQNIAGGTCDAATGYHCISEYRPGQLPDLTTLAQHFAISDNTFSLTDSASWAGHLAIAAASQDHFYGNNPPTGRFPPASGWGCDSGQEAQWITPHGASLMVPSCVPDPSLNPSRYPNEGAFEPTPVSYIPTIMDRLHAAGLSWRIYGAVKGATGYGLWDICPAFAECLDTRQDRHLVSDAQFITDATNGTLPAFSVVTPGGPDFARGCHNLMSMTACDDWAGQLAAAVMNGPDWASAAVFIT